MRPVIVFDGVCNLCNAAVDFVIRRDRGRRFLFASNQSEAGRALLESHGLDPADLRTIYLVEDGRVTDRSTAALRIARGLSGPWKLASGFLVVPRPLRDPVYKLIAHNRYRLFGRRETCRLPTADERARFLESLDDLRRAREEPEPASAPAAAGSAGAHAEGG